MTRDFIEQIILLLSLSTLVINTKFNFYSLLIGIAILVLYFLTQYTNVENYSQIEDKMSCGCKPLTEQALPESSVTFTHTQILPVRPNPILLQYNMRSSNTPKPARPNFRMHIPSNLGFVPSGNFRTLNEEYVFNHAKYLNTLSYNALNQITR